MRKQLLRVVVALSAATLAARPAAAAALDDAKAALAQKQYEKVDALLTADLNGKAPSADALRVSLDSALASGRIVTAGNRVTMLLKATGEKDPALLLSGARIADLNGDSRTALIRYLAFARQAGKSDQADEAFLYILRHENYPEEYKKYVALFGADARSWSLGSGLLARLIEAGDADRTLDLAAFLMQSFPDPENVQAVHRAVRSAAEGYLFGKDPKDRWLKPLQVLAKAQPTDDSQIEAMLTLAGPAIDAETRVRFLLDLMSRSKRPLGQGLVGTLGDYLRALKTDDAKVAAGREYFSHQDLYANSPDKNIDYWYLRQIGESPQVFAVKDKVVVTPEAFIAHFEAYKKKSPQDPGRLVELVQWISQGYFGADTKARAAFLQNNLAWVDRDRLGDLASLTPNLNWAQLLAQWSQGRSYQAVLDARVQQVRYYNDTKDKAGLTATMREYMSAYPGGFSPDHVRSNFIESPLLDAGEKLAVLQEVISKAGYSKPMAALLNGMAQDQANWAKSQPLLQLKAEFDEKPAGSDLLMKTVASLSAMPVNPAQPDNAVAETVKGFLAQYQGPIPGGDAAPTDEQTLLVQQIFNLHRTHVWNNPAAASALAEMWMGRKPLGTDWVLMVRRVREHNGAATLLKMMPVYAALARADKAHNDPEVWNEFGRMTLPAGQAVSPFTEYYDLLTTDQAANWLFNMRDTWGTKRQYLVDEMAKALAIPGAKFTEIGLVSSLVANLTGWGNAPEFKPSPALVQALWDAYLTCAQKTGRWDPDLEANLYGLYARGGKEREKEAAAQFAAWAELVKKRPVEQQAIAYTAFFRWNNTLPSEPAGTPPTPGFKHYTIFKVMKPLYEQISPRLREQITVSNGIIGDIAAQATAPPPADPKTDPKVDPKTYPQTLAAYQASRDEALSYARTLVDLLADGARGDGPHSYYYGLADILARDALAKGDFATANKMLSFYAAYVVAEANVDGAWLSVTATLKALDEKKADESIYAFLSTIQHKGKMSDATARALLLAKAKASTQIPGIIPVGADDPSYPLYLAAHELAVGDEQHAWELTAPKLKLLVQSWAAMDPSYVAWSVEQLRKQKMLKDGLDFSFNILLHEADLDPDVAARILLAKGDIYRDLENYQAARIEYEGLKNNNRYNKIDADSRAVYRMVDLAIVTRDYNAAESLLERLVDADTVQKQADAYYLYAKMAFQKGDFKESRDYLKKVKERVLNHVEAALLEGELNLVLPGGLQNTEVAIGDPRLSTVVIPGRPLTLTLQDPNLSIARGGAAIPVVVTTAKSGDVEHLKLLPSSSNKNLFSAKIATALGKGQKDNLTLELRGDDVVSYEIEQDFQKANDLHYAPKQLLVRYDARLAASSGEILTEEEEEKRELERQMQMRQAGTSRRFEMGRDGRTVRPGSKVFVQVTDFCQDLTDEADKIKVDLKTGLGDVLEGFELMETGPHTGIFRGAVPTGLPLPRASASDSETGKSPASIIQSAPAEAWASLADGRKGKWVEIDTMSSNDIVSLTAQIPHLDQVKDVSVLSMLADDFEELASFPPRPDSHGGLSVELAPEQNGESIEQIRRHLKLAGNAPADQDSPDFDRSRSPVKPQANDWTTARIKGVFYMAENRPLELKWLSPPPPEDWLRCHVLIDGQPVLDGHNSNTVNLTRRIELAKGTHTYELLLRDAWRESKVVVGYKTDAGAFEPIPADWFSIKAHAELAKTFRAKGKIAVDGDQLTLTLDQPRRLRKLRLLFNDFLGTSVSVKSVALKDAAGRQIVPVPKEVAGLASSILPVSPGDTIAVSYNDERRLHEEAKVITAGLNSSYYNGRIVLAEEVITGVGDQRRTNYLEARRCRQGDQLSILVTDFDEDTTEERDSVPVMVKTSGGEKLIVNALETAFNGNDWENKHAGEFLAVLHIGDHTGKDTIKVQPGDTVTVSYLDKENTDPGIPIERSYSISEAGKGAPGLLVYRTRVRMVEDDSAEAKARLKRLAGRYVKGAVLYKPQVIARHPDYTVGGQPATRPGGGQPIAAVNAPLLFEINYPEHVLNSGSVLEVTAVADSELKAAAAEKREPRAVKVPAYVMGIERLAQIKGYPIQLESAFHKDERAMLRDGAFAGVVRLQIGSPGDPIDDMVVGGEREFAREAAGPTEEQAFWYKVPTLLVAGSDIVHLRVKNDQGGITESTVRLLSDGRLELLDPTYSIENDAIHLGEKFHVRLTDPDHDVSNERDTVKVRVTAASGAEVALTLSETLPHSGVFTGTLQPEFIGEPKGSARPTTRPGGDVLFVNFGDDVTFEYVDDLSLESVSPVTVLKKGKILFGADGQVAVFTKKFKDPEIAVKTRFLMAEALFETAKEHRKLNETDRADEEIARGKMILEEAIRDYPQTSLAAQGDYLLANLAQELGRYQEAVGRYSNVISTFPDSEYAGQSQFKKALCFEKLQNYDQACEEYVKLTYIYPENPLVADATVRLGNYYYKKQSYKIAAKIFYNFQQKNPAHKLAAEALFLSAQCNYKLNDFKECIRIFQKVMDEYPDDKTTRPEAIYWLADSDVKVNENVKAFQTFKKLTWDYPESEWAKRARGRLTEEAFSRMQDEQ
jgi:TolA-binding protein